MNRVLLVDDKQDNLEYLSALLKGARYEVATALHGEAALREARLVPPDLIISDLLMPVMDGFSLLRCWRADAVLQKIPFLVYTATYTTPPDEQLALDLGADQFLIKPQDPDVILGRVRKLIDRARMTASIEAPAPHGTQNDILQHYNDALFRKLEDKTRQLEDSKRELLLEIFERGKIAQTQIAILNALPAHIALLDDDGVIMAVNEAWRRFAARNQLGAPAFGVGDNYLSVCESATGTSAQGAPEVSSGLRAVLTGNSAAFNYEYPCHSPTERRWFRMMVTPLHLGRSGGAVVMHIDVSDRKQVEQMLFHSQEQYLLLLNSTEEGIYGVDVEGVCSFCNPAAARLLGFQDPQEILGKLIHEQHHHYGADAGFAANRQCLMQEAFRSGAALHSDKELFYRKDGSQFPAEYWSHPIRKGSEVLGAVVTFLDISERRNLEAQFLQSQKMEAIGRLAGGVAHDFNNALQVIMTCSEMLDDLLVTRPLEHAYIKEIQAASKQGAWLTRHLLAFSRKQFYRPALLDLNAVVVEIEAMLRRIIGADIKLETHYDPNFCGIEADAGQVEQILMNLAVNARDAMPRGGELHIATSLIETGGKADSRPTIPPGRFVLLSVRDSGCGMTAHTLANLFQPFFTTKEEGRGTGLGLSTVYGIVEQSGGYIEVDSQPNQGSTFLIFLPAVDAGMTPAAEAQQLQARRGGHESILVVEDEKALLSMVSTTLRAHGYQVMHANSGVAGIRLGDVTDLHIDLLITDVILPDISGTQVAERLRKVHPAMRVLYISGYTDNQIPHPAVAEGETLLLEKPFSIASLLARIREALDGPPPR